MTKTINILDCDVYCDGGVIGPNPSRIGGTWAFFVVPIHGVHSVYSRSGFVRPDSFPDSVTTNNTTELYAAYRAVSFMLKHGDWHGDLYTDSEVTWHRLIGKKASFTGCPEWLKGKVEEIRHDRKWSVKLVAGHPTRTDLNRGHNKKGTPVSQWNVRCDKECQRLAKKFWRKVTI